MEFYIFIYTYFCCRIDASFQIVNIPCSFIDHTVVYTNWFSFVFERIDHFVRLLRRSKQDALADYLDASEETRAETRSTSDILF